MIRAILRDENACEGRDNAMPYVSTRVRWFGPAREVYDVTKGINANLAYCLLFFIA